MLLVFSAKMWGKLWETFVIVTSLSFSETNQGNLIRITRQIFTTVWRHCRLRRVAAQHRDRNVTTDDCNATPILDQDCHGSKCQAPFTRYNLLSNRMSNRFDKPGKCLYTRYNRLSNPLSNRFDNRFNKRLYRVYSRLSNRLYNPVWQPVWQPVGCLFTRYSRLSVGCITGLTTGCDV